MLWSHRDIARYSRYNVNLALKNNDQVSFLSPKNKTSMCVIYISNSLVK